MQVLRICLASSKLRNQVLIFLARKSTNMPGVRLRDHEDIGGGLRKFKRAVEKSGVLTRARRCQAFEAPSKVKQRERAAAVKRHLKKLSRENMHMGGDVPRSRRGRGE